MRWGPNPGIDILFTGLAPEDGEDWPLWGREGGLTAKNPPRRMIARMVELAVQLGAKVQGDDGEIYNLAGEICSFDAGPAVTDSDAARDIAMRPSLDRETPLPTIRPWWKIW